MGFSQWLSKVVAVCALVGVCGVAAAEDPTVTIKSHAVRVAISGRMAVTTLEQVYVNYTERPAEAVFQFRLPPDAAVTDLAMWVNGLRSPAEIQPRVSAAGIYRQIVNGRRDPALLQYVGEGLWQLQLFPIPARGTQKVEMSFVQLLPLKDGKLVYQSPQAVGGTATVAQDFDFSAAVRCPGGVKDIVSPSHEIGIQRVRDGELLVGLRTEHGDLSKPVVLDIVPGENPPAVVTWSGKDGACFVSAISLSRALASGKPRPRTAVLVLDVSQSMDGGALATARVAAAVILKELAEEDRFAIVLAGSDATRWKKELVPATDRNKEEAYDFISKTTAGGGTDLLAALRAAASFNTDKNRLCDVFLITDGDDTVGDSLNDAANAPSLNDGEAISRLRAAAKAPSSAPATGASRPAIDSALGTEPPANLRVWGLCLGGAATGELQQVAEWTGGAVSPLAAGMELPLDLSPLLEQVRRPVVRDIRFAMESPEGTGLSQTGCGEYAGGLELVVSGRFQAEGTVTAAVSCVIDGQPAKETTEFKLPPLPDAGAAWSCPEVETVWAYLRASHMCQELKARRPEMGDLRAVADLSRRYRVLTPATALLVLESDADYLRRGIRREVSSLEAGESASAGARRFSQPDPHKMSEADARSVASRKAEARELQRLGHYGRAGELLDGVVTSAPSDYDAAYDSALLKELAALREVHDRAASAQTGRRETWKNIPWYLWLSRQSGADSVPIAKAADLAPGPPLAIKVSPLLLPEEQGVSETLQKKLPLVDVDNNELKDVVQWFREATGLNVYVKWNVLSQAGIEKDARINVKLSGVSAERALRAVLEQVGAAAPLGYSLADGVITITTKEDMDRRVATRMYDIRDLTGVFHGLPPLSRGGGSGIFGNNAGTSIFGNSDEGPSWGGSGGGTWGDDGSAPSPKGSGASVSLPGTPTDPVNTAGTTKVYDIRDLTFRVPNFVGPVVNISEYGSLRVRSVSDLIDMMKSTVAPYSWRPTGELADIREFGGLLVVTQTWPNQEAVMNLITEIRRHLPLVFENVETPMPAEAMFTSDAHVSAWVLDLLAKARSGGLSEFSSVRTARVGGRLLARIGGIWLAASMTPEAKVYVVSRGSEAASALFAASPGLKECLQSDARVIACAAPSAAVCLGAGGIAKRDEADLKKLLELLGKAATPR